MKTTAVLLLMRAHNARNIHIPDIRGQRSSANANVTKGSNTKEMSAWHAQTGHIRIRSGSRHVPCAAPASMETTRKHKTAASTAKNAVAESTRINRVRLIAKIVLTILNRHEAVMTDWTVSVTRGLKLRMETHAKNVILDSTRVQPIILCAMHARGLIWSQTIHARN